MARRVVVAALVIVGLMALGGYFGYSQGYDAGLASDGGRDGFSAFFLGIGLLFKFLLVFFLVSLIAKLFFFRRWARHGGGGRPATATGTGTTASIRTMMSRFESRTKATGRRLPEATAVDMIRPPDARHAASGGRKPL